MSYYSKKRRVREKQFDDWLMTYADMITLLLCFFAILLALSVPKKEQFDLMKKMVAEQFASKAILDKMTIEPVNEVKPVPSGLLSGLESIIDMYGIKNNVTIKETDGAITVGISSDPFYTKGSATLSDEGKWLMEELAKNFSDNKFKDYKIIIEGHTDDTPVNTPEFSSNWELSTARAITALRFFISHGIDVKKLGASGYAGALPELPNRDEVGKPIADNQAKNRRLVIRIRKIENDET
jgi:chemotaxis protein MotB